MAKFLGKIKNKSKKIISTSTALTMFLGSSLAYARDNPSLEEVLKSNSEVYNGKLIVQSMNFQMELILIGKNKN